LYGWIRDLHLYFGLFLSPFVLLFAVSTILFNHTWTPWAGGGEPQTRTVAVQPPAGLEGIERARDLLRQAEVSGEIRHLRGEGDRFTIPVIGPGWEATVRVDLAEGFAEVTERTTGFWNAILYLHKSPGPHSAAIRGNWTFTLAWRWLIDGVVCLILFVSASGIYLWWALRAERRTGLVLLGAGGVCFVGLVFLVVIW
jgi:hypothetical protein